MVNHGYSWLTLIIHGYPMCALSNVRENTQHRHLKRRNKVKCFTFASQKKKTGIAQTSANNKTGILKNWIFHYLFEPGSPRAFQFLKNPCNVKNSSNLLPYPSFGVWIQFLAKIISVFIP